MITTQMITTEMIKNLRPCEKRFNNYLYYYGENKTFTYAEFISLKKISFSDKIWVLTYLMTLENLVLFAKEIAYRTQETTQCADQQKATRRLVAQKGVTLYAQYAAKPGVEDFVRYATRNVARYGARYGARHLVLNLTLKYLK